LEQINSVGHPAEMPVRLSDPEVVESKGVTHLTYTVLK
jgi:hypothetical protein